MGKNRQCKKYTMGIDILLKTGAPRGRDIDSAQRC